MFPGNWIPRAAAPRPAAGARAGLPSRAPPRTSLEAVRAGRGHVPQARDAAPGDPNFTLGLGGLGGVGQGHGDADVALGKLVALEHLGPVEAEELHDRLARVAHGLAGQRHG